MADEDLDALAEALRRLGAAEHTSTGFDADVAWALLCQRLSTRSVTGDEDLRSVPQQGSADPA